MDMASTGAYVFIERSLVYFWTDSFHTCTQSSLSEELHTEAWIFDLDLKVTLEFDFKSSVVNLSPAWRCSCWEYQTLMAIGNGKVSLQHFMFFFFIPYRASVKHALDVNATQSAVMEWPH